MKNDDEIKVFLKKFEDDYFHTKSLPVDVQKLITHKLKNGLDRVFHTIDVKLREAGDTYSLISHDYLNDRARGNLHTMANVQAMVTPLCFLWIQKGNTIYALERPS